MKRFTTLCVLTAALCVSCTHSGQRGKAAAPDSVFPRFTLYAAQQPVPRAVIASLPRRISALPQGRSATIRRVVERLGLAAWRDNVSINHRWGVYFMYLDSSHILWFTMDSDTLPKDFTFQTPWKSRVTECALRRNPDITVISRKLADP